MSDPCVQITEFTDPACPWAFSAEPFRLRIDWLYEGHVEWQPRMVVLSDTRQDNIDKDLTPEKLAAGFADIARDHKMPIDTRLRPAVPASRAACRAVVAARLHADYWTMRLLLRRLRVRYMAGGMLDDPDLIAAAAADAGIGDEIDGWMEDPEVERALQADHDEARAPIPAAKVLDHKLANWSGGRRYTCPSYEVTRREDGVKIAIPGFQPFAVYDAILANLVPGLERRDPPTSAAEVLEWRGIPLSTQEVATVCDVDFDSAREELGRVATQSYAGADGYWDLNGA